MTSNGELIGANVIQREYFSRSFTAMMIEIIRRPSLSSVYGVIRLAVQTRSCMKRENIPNDFSRNKRLCPRRVVPADLCLNGTRTSKYFERFHRQERKIGL